MKIKLNIDNKEKIFYLKKVKGSLYRRFLEIQQILIDSENSEKGYGLEHFDMMVTFICQAFNNQFTENELLDDIGADEIALKFYEIAKFVSDKTAEGMKRISKN